MHIILNNNDIRELIKEKYGYHSTIELTLSEQDEDGESGKMKVHVKIDAYGETKITTCS